MPRRTTNYTGIEESGWRIDDAMLAYMDRKYPNIDPEETYELFRDNCLANDRIYASWPAAFRNWLRNPADWGGFAFKEGMENDPSWRQLIIEARAMGFREPRNPFESPQMYRQAMKAYVPETDLLGGRLNVANILKKIP